MFGKILSTAVEVVTLPIDVADIGMDVLVGGDGSKASREQNDATPTRLLTDIRDGICETLEDIDK